MDASTIEKIGTIITSSINVISAIASAYCASKACQYYCKVTSVCDYGSLSQCILYIVQSKEVYRKFPKILAHEMTLGFNKIAAFREMAEEIIGLIEKCKSTVPASYSSGLRQKLMFENREQLTDIFVDMMEKREETELINIWQKHKREIYDKLDKTERFLKEAKENGQNQILK